ncbi:hypothetical protein VNO77_22887 [Canavalia gladiata]|uniref:Uncharacterized protein n=1 Tax=Canavalia gladiata TaxID=3824 RepID=A0AAN9L6R6_CANGL
MTAHLKEMSTSIEAPQEHRTESSEHEDFDEGQITDERRQWLNPSLQKLLEVSSGTEMSYKRGSTDNKENANRSLPGLVVTVPGFPDGEDEEDNASR